MVLRFNPPPGGPGRLYNFDLVDADGANTWHSHPDPDIDIAVAPIGVSLLREHGMQFSYFKSNSQILDRDGCIAAGLSEGDGVFVLGFPLGDAGTDRNYAVVRHGIVARIRDYLAQESKTLLIDSSVFPGNSGGPVITRPEVLAVAGTPPYARASLIGVVSEYVAYTDVAISAQTRRPRVSFEENTGLSRVVPISYARDAIEPLISDAERARSAAPVGRPA